MLNSSIDRTVALDFQFQPSWFLSHMAIVMSRCFLFVQDPMYDITLHRRVWISQMNGS